jgi:hypothetical protein
VREWIVKRGSTTARNGNFLGDSFSWREGKVLEIHQARRSHGLSQKCEFEAKESKIEVS